MQTLCLKLRAVFTVRQNSFASAVYVTAGPSVRRTPVLCQNEGMQSDAVFTIGSPSISSFLMLRRLMGTTLSRYNLSAKRLTPGENSRAVHISPYNSGTVIDSEKSSINELSTKVARHP